MRLAVTIWGNRISPVFDAARTLLIADIQNGVIRKKTYKTIEPLPPADLVRLLKQMDVSTLICGAISTGPADLITAHDIRLVSFVTGNAMTILDDFAAQESIHRDHMMPGCPPPLFGI
ncbi:NifB/NifX family molybdenum-iron cluster-binding protein [Desulfospira joergensenii]|uniref:NifB/NifX family molybdenum-iron cluster-binding protein n=1 Tax=Desulfospira joergensenii TaxID=53329 RepID=UPI0003B5E815|nr:NifB/NifX family molybdenum-iron cluster-binding protein [Desulfospira joergensenii]